jgi:hypothetical protein
MLIHSELHLLETIYYQVSRTSLQRGELTSLDTSNMPSSIFWYIFAAVLMNACNIHVHSPESLCTYEQWTLSADMNRVLPTLRNLTYWDTSNHRFNCSQKPQIWLVASSFESHAQGLTSGCTTYSQPKCKFNLHLQHFELSLLKSPWISSHFP